jgi:hypothetical protein
MMALRLMSQVNRVRQAVIDEGWRQVHHAIKDGAKEVSTLLDDYDTAAGRQHFTIAIRDTAIERVASADKAEDEEDEEDESAVAAPKGKGRSAASKGKGRALVESEDDSDVQLVEEEEDNGTLPDLDDAAQL